MKKPKILIFDIETSPIEAYVWGLRDQNVGLQQIKEDWSVLSWSAKWLGEKEVMYADTRNEKNPRNDKKILQQIWKLLDESDVVITQNGLSFDAKKLNSRFIIQGMQPPSSYRHIDLLRISRKQFAHTSNKLAYVTDKLNKKYKKLDHKKFPGFSMWKECLKGNKNAFKEMEIYNKYDVLSLEESYNLYKSWDNSINLNVYNEDGSVVCTCGSTSLLKRGFSYSNTGKFQRYRCNKCGKEFKDGVNLLKNTKKILR
jgi:DNA polymerase elongation subunit (family B)